MPGCTQVTHRSNASMSNRQDFPTLTPGSFPSDARRHTVASFKPQKIRDLFYRNDPHCPPHRFFPPRRSYQFQTNEQKQEDFIN